MRMIVRVTGCEIFLAEYSPTPSENQCRVDEINLSSSDFKLAMLELDEYGTVNQNSGHIKALEDYFLCAIHNGYPYHFDVCILECSWRGHILE